MVTEALRRAFRDDSFTASEAALVLGIRGPSSTLNRLKASGVLERTSRGVYRFAPLDSWQRIDLRLEREALRSTRRDREAILGRLATQRWATWLASGYVNPLGPRRYAVQIQTTRGEALRVRRK